jgi:hypothetical protein
VPAGDELDAQFPSELGVLGLGAMELTATELTGKVTGELAGNAMRVATVTA